MGECVPGVDYHDVLHHQRVGIGSLSAEVVLHEVAAVAVLPEHDLVLIPRLPTEVLSFLAVQYFRLGVY